MLGRTPRTARILLLSCFLLSGFTALLYQTVWMRLSLAAFGVNTSVVAAVLAVFMLGLALGTFGAPALLARADARAGLGPLKIYGIAELLVALGGLFVPSLLRAGRHALLAVGPENGGQYTVLTAVLLAAILLPFCTAMGVTFPAAVAFLRAAGASAAGELPFSALYVANVVGALLGAVVTPVCLIELFGFTTTCRAAAAGNVLIAVAAVTLFAGTRLADHTVPEAGRKKAAPPDASSRPRRLALFVTGFSTMGMEVIWMRVYPTVIGTFVYSFATIVAVYLLATTVGSALYRRVRSGSIAGNMGLWFPWLGAASILPLLSASVWWNSLPSLLRVVIGLAPFCGLLGFVTPALVDREAGDDPGLVARAYGLNLIGCLLGPLVAGYVLLPAFGNAIATLIVALPLFLLLLTAPLRAAGRPAVTLGAVVLAAVLFRSVHLFESDFPPSQMRRDHVATVVAAGTGMNKILFVNGVGMTVLTPVTKMMAHFPAALLGKKGPLDAVVICFGMGTTFRSLGSWNANVTAVELVPSVPDLFSYFHPDGPEIVRASNGRMRIVHDDGRRFLDRSHERYDLITIDPPPPVEAAGSSLLYSKEFYESVRRKLAPGGILQTWLPPEADRATIGGVIASVLDSFPHVKVFRSIFGNGYHITASNDPIPELSPAQMVARMPEAAIKDMTEWSDVPAQAYFDAMLGGQYAPPESLLIDGKRSATLAISDDRPVNEFYLLRRFAEGTRPPGAAFPP